MDFKRQLNEYMETLGATGKELAEASDLSAATVSRYLNGRRSPAGKSSQVRQLAAGFRKLADERGADMPSEEDIAAVLDSTLENTLDIEYEEFLSNIKALLNCLDIKVSELARGIYSDPSYVSRILSGARRPGRPAAFADEVSAYAARRFADSSELYSLAQLIGADASDLVSEAVIKERISAWLGSNRDASSDTSFPSFLTKMDDFDLNDYMKAIHFDELKLPPMLPQMPVRKEYAGVRRMMDGELEFLKSTVMSKSMEPCIMYSDMPMEDMAADPDFPKKYMLGMAMMLKKGLHLNVIHDIHRPFEEMMLGLESFIPMYMTGQISPYCLPAAQNGVFNHYLRVSGAAALEGMAIAGDHDGGKYVLYRSKDDVAHYRRRAEALLGKARPLMDIFREDRREEFPSVIQKAFTERQLSIICSSLPAYLLSEESMAPLLSSLSSKKAGAALEYYREMRAVFAEQAARRRLHLILPELSRDEYDRSPVALSLTDLFAEERLVLSYESYMAYTGELKAFADKNAGLTLESDPRPAFRNINIMIAGDSMVIVSKQNSPAIHFVIYNRQMINAFRKFKPPIVE